MIVALFVAGLITTTLSSRNMCFNLTSYSLGEYINVVIALAIGECKIKSSTDQSRLKQ